LFSFGVMFNFPAALRDEPPPAIFVDTFETNDDACLAGLVGLG